MPLDRSNPPAVSRFVLRWIALIVVGCGSSTPARPSDPPKPTTAIDAAAPASIDAMPLDAMPIDAALPSSVAGDPPEPVQPVVECSFARSVFCMTGTPTRVALQTSPFEWCARTQKARKTSVYPDEPKFSAAETRARRKTEPEACCYVEFSSMACD